MGILNKKTINTVIFITCMVVLVIRNIYEIYLSNKYYKLNKEILEINKNIRRENKRLKYLCDKYEEEHKTTFETWLKDIGKIDKALELLDSYKLGKYDYALTPAGLLEFEDILRGKTNDK